MGTDLPVYEVTGGGSWRAEVGARLEELANRLAAVPPNAADAQMQATRIAARSDLDRAYKATGGEGSPLGSWFSGSSLTKAWEAVHNAERALLKIETDAAVLAAVPPILSWTRRAMDAGPIREEHEATLKGELSQPRTPALAGVEGLAPPPDRAAIRGALSDVVAANRLRYADLRTFRNNLIIATVLLIVGLLLIAAWHARDPNFLSLCAEPKGEATKCLTGGTIPHSADIWKVLLVGALGGALGFVFRLSATTGADRFDPKTWQRLLKPVTGAAAALAGVVFLQSGLLVESTIKNTELALLGYALIFGFSQQVLTKFVDGRAESLVKPAAK